jgi:protein-L-isoaspartate(D-aspartate) O-methyltransferase
MDRDSLIEDLKSGGYLKSPRLIEAFREIDRKDFVPKELWDEAYENYPLPIGYGQTISQPLTVAFMLELLAPKPGEKILDIGAGSGWTTALLAKIVGEKGCVVGIERIAELCKFSEANVRKYNFVSRGTARFFCGDATVGAPIEFVPRGGFDKILAGAAAAGGIPDAWRKQLKVGGRIVAPVLTSVIVLDKISEKEFKEKEYFGFSFVPLIED